MTSENSQPDVEATDDVLAPATPGSEKLGSPASPPADPDDDAVLAPATPGAEHLGDATDDA
ncbi:hypothetical protein [Williamsia sp. 1135]|uniref:hypothetical protein n=1 Tax=Williamsia sp. 1135 TaxID=1889262 RepID=UPI000A11A4BB|nr:hypothetical protein [Williamsia sp. 1135]ORM30618.1 hypothetical protein BFL43_18500 [Williamsia sp. 1135]